MKLIAGLGNPGDKYVSTRHNAGFMCIDKISSYFDIPVAESGFKAVLGKGKISGESVILAKPLTYMNLSGESLVGISRFYNIAPSDIVVFYDDISLPHSRLRVRSRGSHGGHNGMKNIISLFGTDEIPRVRFGIKGRSFGSVPLEKYVLSAFSEDELDEVRTTLSIIPELLNELIFNGIDKAMTVYNKK